MCSGHSQRDSIRLLYRIKQQGIQQEQAILSFANSYRKVEMSIPFCNSDLEGAFENSCFPLISRILSCRSISLLCTPSGFLKISYQALRRKVEVKTHSGTQIGENVFRPGHQKALSGNPPLVHTLVLVSKTGYLAVTPLLQGIEDVGTYKSCKKRLLIPDLLNSARHRGKHSKSSVKANKIQSYTRCDRSFPLSNIR